jgi:glycosyltransferase involved in cell wall biosynthesis
MSSASAPKISVIVPNYNHARFLPRRIDTILAQTIQDFELILLDDCSTDDSRSILSSYAGDPRVRIEFNTVNSGSAFRQWNKGVRLARGRYVWIAESDDYADERFLERLVPLLESNPKMQFGYCRSWCVRDGNRLDGFAETHFSGSMDHVPWTKDYCEDGREVCRKYLVRANILLNASAVLFQKAAYEQVGGVDDTMYICGDWKLWAAMALEGSVAYACEPLNYFRFHGASVRNKSAQGAVDVTEALQVVRWILDRVTPQGDILRKTYRTCAGLWGPWVLGPRVSPVLRAQVLRCARAVDPHPFRRIFPPALIMIRLKVRRHWHDLMSLLTGQRSRWLTREKGNASAKISTD